MHLDLREGDMRDLALDEPAALIYCPFRALLHLPTWADRRRTFERVAAALRPGGRFAWAAFAFDHQLAVRYDGVHQAEPVPHTVRYAVGENRVDIVLDDGARASAWWATKNEWLGLIDVARLELEALYGGFAGEPFTEDSREYVFVTRAPVSTGLPGSCDRRDEAVRRPAARRPELQRHRTVTGACLGRGAVGPVTFFGWRMCFPGGPRPWARPRATGEPTSR